MLVTTPLIKLTVRATPLSIMHQIRTKNPDTQISKLQQRTRYACLSLQFLFIRNNTDLLLEHLIINTSLKLHIRGYAVNNPRISWIPVVRR